MKLKPILLFCLFSLIALSILLPFFAIFIASFKDSKDLFRYGLNMDLTNVKLTFDNYAYLFTGSHDYFTWYFNSLMIVFIQVPLSLFLSAGVAYGFAMYEFKAKKYLFLCVLIVMMIPLEILMLPLYSLSVKLNLINTMQGIILPFIVSPFLIFFFRQYLQGIHKSFVEAARIDGYNEYRIFMTIVLPLMKPSFAAMGIFQAMSVWNSFLWPLLVLNSSSKYTLPIGLTSLLTPYGNNYKLLIAGSLIAILPIFLVFVFFRRHFIGGMMAGGVKE